MDGLPVKNDKICLITTCINAFIFVLMLIGVLLIIINPFDFDAILRKAGEIITGAEADRITGGYEVLGGLGLGLLGIFGIMAVIVVIAIIIFVMLLMLPGIISGIVAYVRYKKHQIDGFKTDSVIKIITNGILTFLCVASISKAQPWWIMAALLPASVVFLSICSLQMKA